MCIYYQSKICLYVAAAALPQEIRSRGAGGERSLIIILERACQLFCIEGMQIEWDKILILVDSCNPLLTRHPTVCTQPGRKAALFTSCGGNKACLHGENNNSPRGRWWIFRASFGVERCNPSHYLPVPADLFCFWSCVVTVDLLVMVALALAPSKCKKEIFYKHIQLSLTTLLLIRKIRGRAQVKIDISLPC